MGMVVRTNNMAINANRQLGVNQGKVSKSLEKLSSGFKINRAGDDAAGLAISEKMKAQIKGLDQAAANSQDGISLIQTAEGALTETHDMLNRMVELATKSANGTIQDDVDREAIQKEVDSLNTEITRISKATNFNGINLLDGSLGGTKGVATDVKLQLDPNMKAALADSVGVKGVKDTGALLDIAKLTATAAQGNELEYTFTIDRNGVSESHTVKLTQADASKEVKYSIDGGDEVSLGANWAATGGELLAAEVGTAMKTALDTTSWAKDFTITAAAGALKFTAVDVGASKPTLSSVAYTYKGGATAQKTGTVGVTETAKGLDKVPQLDLDKLAIVTADSKADAASKVFEIGGRKFAIVGAGADTSALGLGSDVVQIELDTGAGGGGAAADAADAKKIVDEINKVVGSEVIHQQQATDTKVSVGPAAGSKNNAAQGGLTLQIGDTNDDFNKVTVQLDDMSAKGLGTAGLDVSNQDVAGNSIKTIKAAINHVSDNRATLGALQNRLEHTINNLNVTSENMTAANSAIRDTDMAKEMMEYTKMNVLTQAAQAMLAQANQQPQAILQLLQ